MKLPSLMIKISLIDAKSADILRTLSTQLAKGFIQRWHFHFALLTDITKANFVVSCRGLVQLRGVIQSFPGRIH